MESLTTIEDKVANKFGLMVTIFKFFGYFHKVMQVAKSLNRNIREHSEKQRNVIKSYGNIVTMRMYDEQLDEFSKMIGPQISYFTFGFYLHDGKSVEKLIELFTLFKEMRQSEKDRSEFTQNKFELDICRIDLNLHSGEEYDPIELIKVIKEIGPKALTNPKCIFLKKRNNNYQIGEISEIIKSANTFFTEPFPSEETCIKSFVMTQNSVSEESLLMLIPNITYCPLNFNLFLKSDNPEIIKSGIENKALGKFVQSLTLNLEFDFEWDNCDKIYNVLYDSISNNELPDLTTLAIKSTSVHDSLGGFLIGIEQKQSESEISQQFAKLKLIFENIKFKYCKQNKIDIKMNEECSLLLND